MPTPLPEPGCLLFAYGSLLLPTGVSYVDKALARWTTPLGSAVVRGLLYDLGDYPGLKLAAHGSEGTVVSGRLLQLRDPRKALAALDRFEEFFPASPEASEFVRVSAPVMLGPSRRLAVAQVYVYNRSARGRRRILPPDYLAYRRLRQKEKLR